MDGRRSPEIFTPPPSQGCRFRVRVDRNRSDSRLAAFYTRRPFINDYREIVKTIIIRRILFQISNKSSGPFETVVWWVLAVRVTCNGQRVMKTLLRRRNKKYRTRGGFLARSIKGNTHPGGRVRRVYTKSVPSAISHITKTRPLLHVFVNFPQIFINDSRVTGIISAPFRPLAIRGPDRRGQFRPSPAPCCPVFSAPSFSTLFAPRTTIPISRPTAGSARAGLRTSRSFRAHHRIGSLDRKTGKRGACARARKPSSINPSGRKFSIRPPPGRHRALPLLYCCVFVFRALRFHRSENVFTPNLPPLDCYKQMRCGERTLVRAAGPAYVRNSCEFNFLTTVGRATGY